MGTTILGNPQISYKGFVSQKPFIDPSTSGHSCWNPTWPAARSSQPPWYKSKQIHTTPGIGHLCYLCKLVANYIQLAMFLLKWFCVTKFLVFQCFCCVKTEWHDIEKNVRFRHKYLYQWPSSTVQQPDASPATPARLTRMLQMWARPMKRHVSGSSLLGFWLLCASKFQPCGLTAHAFSTVGPSTFQSK